MSKEKRRVPKLRFPGFTEDWEQRKFGEIYERAGQKNDLTYGIDKIISVANMYFKIDATVGSEEYLKTYNVFKLGDIAFEGHTNKEHSYGRFVENTIGDGIVSHIFDVFTPKINLDINFWKELIKYEPIMGPILRRCTKASRMMSNLTSKEFLEEKILCPTLEEQKLIGEFIVRIDKNITLHQRKLEHLNLKKKALLQKLFPKNGERYPELRFPGFTDAWEQCKLGDIVDFLDGQRKPLKESERIKGKYPYYGASGIIDYINDYLFDENLVLLSEDGANIIDRNYPVCFIATGKYWVNNHAHVLKVKTGVIDKFICESLERLDYTKFNTGTAQPKLNQDICQKIIITIPNESEQKCISECLDRINNIITLHQRKLEHLQLQKKALLQQMFV